MWTDLDVDMDPFEDNSSDYITFTMDYNLRSTHPMFLYELLQTGIILVTLVAGILCLIKLIFITGTRCKNFDLLFTTLIVGFLHLITCILMLGVSEDSALIETPRGGNQHCVDYFLPATIANTAVLVTITLCVIDRNVTSYIWRLMLKFAFLTTIGAGLYLMYRTGNSEGTNPLHQEVFFTFDTKDYSQVNFFWSVCLKSLSDARYRLQIEYCFIYSPVVVVIIGAWIFNYLKTKGRHALGLHILATDCTESDSPDDHIPFRDIKLPHRQTKCFCTRLNSAFVAILVYCVIILLILRPAMIVYGYVTSGNIRDLLPSLLQTVMYCFLCSEFLLRVYRQRTYKIRRQLIAANFVVLV